MTDILDMLAFLSIIAGPVILIWGIVRSVFFGAVKVAGEVTGGQTAVTSGQRGYRRGTILILVGLGLIAYSVLVFWLS